MGQNETFPDKFKYLESFQIVISIIFHVKFVFFLKKLIVNIWTSHCRLQVQL